MNLYIQNSEWRATVGFNLFESQTSYQGEINPFPQKASLLTFHPFIQHKRLTIISCLSIWKNYPS